MSPGLFGYLNPLREDDSSFGFRIYISELSKSFSFSQPVIGLGRYMTPLETMIHKARFVCVGVRRNCWKGGFLIILKNDWNSLSLYFK